MFVGLYHARPFARAARPGLGLSALSPQTASRSLCTGGGVSIALNGVFMRVRGNEVRAGRQVSRPRTRSGYRSSRSMSAPSNDSPDEFVPKESDQVLKTTYAIPAVFCGLAAAGLLKGEGWSVAAFPLALFGPFLLLQTSVVRFVFTDTELVVAKKSAGGKLKYIRAWKLDDITNWEMWWEPFPVLCYFKEKGSYDGRGSIHFFPMLFDGKQLVHCFQTRTKIQKGNYSSE
ncbi:hypothetical protein FVE85_5750 [Porphyridium purpureum]|uniref:Uncharacterized protein n=1 Tax=Porphyridium purpureum TaxID=35688 RepID=A0A5J4Z4B1_PORPP|nr:hypothetical protein FVE85_5750 [Porphyridium purpureum]|eukprot:POR6220..scf295_1